MPFFLEQSARRVDVWSSAAPSRLESEGDALIGELLAALAKLDPIRSSEILVASCTSADKKSPPLADVFLLPGVGAALAHLTEAGFRFVRRNQAPAPPSCAGEFSCQVTFELLPQTDVAALSGTMRPCAKWVFEFPTRGALNTEVVWNGFREGKIEHQGTLPRETPYAILFRLAPAGSRRFKPLGLAPAFLTGILSALHQAEGSDISEVSRRVAKKLNGVDAKSVASALQSPANAVLGKRVLVKRHGADLEWTPNKEDCVLIDCRVDSGGGHKNQCRGTLFDASFSTTEGLSE